MTISRMRRHAPFGPTDPNFCMWGGVADVINCAKFFENQFRSSGAGRPWKRHFPLKAFIALTTVLRYRADCKKVASPKGRKEVAIGWWTNFDDTFSRFDIILECDEQTDSLTDGQNCYVNIIASHKVFTIATKNVLFEQTSLQGYVTRLAGIP